MISWRKLFPWAFFFPFPSSKTKTKKGGQKEKLNIKISDPQKWNLWDAEIEAVLLWTNSCLLPPKIVLLTLAIGVAGAKLSTTIGCHHLGIYRQFSETGVSEQMDPLAAREKKVTFPWVNLFGKLSFAKLYVSVCTHSITLTMGEVISLEFSFRTVEVFICEPCDLDGRSLAKELNVDM